MSNKGAKKREGAGTKADGDSLQARFKQLSLDRQAAARDAEGPVNAVYGSCELILKRSEAFRVLRDKMIDLLVVLRDLENARSALEELKKDAEEHQGDVGTGALSAAQKTVERESTKLRGLVGKVKEAIQSVPIPNDNEKDQMKTFVENTNEFASVVKSVGDMIFALQIVSNVYKCTQVQLQLRGWEHVKGLRSDLDSWKQPMETPQPDSLTDLDIRAAKSALERVQEIHRKALGLQEGYKKNKNKDPKSELKKWMEEMTRLKNQANERAKKR